MKFTADLEIFGRVAEVECHCTDSSVWKVMRGDDDLSVILNIKHVEEELHKQHLDYLANLEAGV